jgi:hypothetical protein
MSDSDISLSRIGWALIVVLPMIAAIPGAKSARACEEKDAYRGEVCSQILGDPRYCKSYIKDKNNKCESCYLEIGNTCSSRISDLPDASRVIRMHINEYFLDKGVELTLPPTLVTAIMDSQYGNDVASGRAKLKLEPLDAAQQTWTVTPVPAGLVRGVKGSTIGSFVAKIKVEADQEQVVELATTASDTANAEQLKNLKARLSDKQGILLGLAPGAESVDRSVAPNGQEVAVEISAVK